MITEKKLTQEELNGIDARSGKATQGPWKCERCSFSEDGNVLYELTGIQSGNINDARFIESSREDVPALLGHIKYLEEENRRLVKELRKFLMEEEK